MTPPSADSSAEVFRRLNDLERRGAADEQRWEFQGQWNRARDAADAKRDEEIDRICDRLTVLNTTFRVWGAAIALVVAVAEIVVPMLRG